VVTDALAVLDDSGRIGSLLIEFSEQMTRGPAEARRNYRINLNEKGTGPVVPISGVSYNPSDLTVTIRLAQSLAPEASFRLVIVGRTPGGLTNQRGIGLDGNADGNSGDNFVAIFRNGRLLRDSEGMRGPRTGAVSAVAIDSIFDGDA